MCARPFVVGGGGPGSSQQGATNPATDVGQALVGLLEADAPVGGAIDAGVAAHVGGAVGETPAHGSASWTDSTRRQRRPPSADAGTASRSPTWASVRCACRGPRHRYGVTATVVAMDHGRPELEQDDREVVMQLGTGKRAQPIDEGVEGDL